MGLGIIPQEFNDLFHHHDHVDRHRTQGTGSCVAEKLAQQTVQAITLAHHDIQKASLCAGPPTLSGNHLGRAADRRQGVTYLVGEPRG